MIAAASSVSSVPTWLAAVAVAATALVGILGALVPAVSASRRQKHELARDRERHIETLAAERDREVRQARREVLTNAVVALHEMRIAFGETRPMPNHPGHVDPDSIDAIKVVAPSFREHKVLLRIWFPSDSDVVRTFDEATVQVGLRLAPHESDERKRLAEEHLWAELDRFEEAARRYLTDVSASTD